jgi:hypothetical protein
MRIIFKKTEICELPIPRCNFLFSSNFQSCECKFIDLFMHLRPLEYWISINLYTLDISIGYLEILYNYVEYVDQV